MQKPENILIESLTTCKIKVIDYGNAYLHHDQRCSYVQSRAYRAPEVVLGLSYSTKVDMWSLGCILMELFTGKLLFDNTSVQAPRACHSTARMVPYCTVSKHRGTARCSDIAGFPYRASWGVSRGHAEWLSVPSLLRHGNTVRCSPPLFPPAHALFPRTFLLSFPRRGAPQCLVGKHDGRLCRMRPYVSSIARVLAHYGCNDAVFADFISELLQNDPVRRPSAEQSLNHGWLQQSGSGTCTKYCLSSKDCGEAGQRLQSKYPSMNDLDSPSSIQSTTDYLDSDELIGPATPQSFREQCYLDRERGEKKKVDKKWSRKSIGQRLSGSSLSAAVSHRTAPPLSSSTGERCSYTIHSDEKALTQAPSWPLSY